MARKIEIRAYNTDIPEQVLHLCGACASALKADVIEGYDLSCIAPEHLTCSECDALGGV